MAAASNGFGWPEADDHLSSGAVVVGDLPLVGVRERVPFANVSLQPRVEVSVGTDASAHHHATMTTRELRRVDGVWSGEVENESRTGHGLSLAAEPASECVLPHVPVTSAGPDPS